MVWSTTDHHPYPPCTGAPPAVINIWSSTPVGRAHIPSSRARARPTNQEDPSFFNTDFLSSISLVCTSSFPQSPYKPHALTTLTTAPPHRRTPPRNTTATRARSKKTCSRLFAGTRHTLAPAAALAFDQRPTHEATSVSGREEEERNKVQSTHLSRKRQERPLKTATRPRPWRPHCGTACGTWHTDDSRYPVRCLGAAVTPPQQRRRAPGRWWRNAC
jgi:hypothetical protein